MKLSPFWLFLILLIVLIFSVMFMKPRRESFVGFYGSTPSNTASLTIPNYSNPVYKLYDNDFFDPTNGNILRVYATEYDVKVGQDTAGTTIDYVALVDRSSTTTEFKKGTTISHSLTSVPNSYQTWTVYSTDPTYSKITSNQIIYSPWGQDTYVHVLDLNNKLNACGFMFGPSYATPIYTNFNTNLVKLGASKQDKSADNDSFVKDDTTGQIFYQFTSQISYSSLTGDLILTDKSGKQMIYTRNGSFSNSLSTGAIASATTPWVEYDTVGNHMVLYVPTQTNTTIIVLSHNSDATSYKIDYARRFTADGSLLKDANTIVKATVSTDTTDKTKSKKTGGSPSGHSRVWDSDMEPIYTNAQINDYILKNQVVPVCPSCPKCPEFPNFGTCSSCGKTSNASEATAAPSSPRMFGSPSGVSSTLNAVGTDAGNLVKGASSGTAGVISSVGGDAASLIRNTASGTKNMIESAGSGASDLLYDTGSGAKNLAENLGSGTVGLLRDTGSGIKSLFSDKDQQGGSQGGSQGGAQGGSQGQSSYGGQGSGPQNPFTYNGALTERPNMQSNFVPLTTDFSRFGR